MREMGVIGKKCNYMPRHIHVSNSDYFRVGIFFSTFILGKPAKEPRRLNHYG